MKERLEKLLSRALAELDSAGSLEAVEGIKARYLGRKGELASFFRELAGLPAEDRREAGAAINAAKESLAARIEGRIASFTESGRAERLAAERIDVTLPGRRPPRGGLHPVTRVLDTIEEIFYGLGFDVAEGPEVELDYYNFEALNIPADHPARDMQDTFYVGPEVLLRTHTSPVQIRVMENRKPPIKIIAPGTVYRRDSDITHTPMFHQVEGFMVDTSVRMSDLKGVLTHFLHSLFGEGTEIRFRPSFFPFVEPGAEMDIRCVICGGSGCRVCKGTGWLEILGAGMIHPNVLAAVNYDPGEVSGFAFGMGVERIAMLKYGIDDLRLFFENDLRFLAQF
ncbi:MAG: phenylalanine--tRNA ligase subunit alpha [Thermodesulfobacteriota bacterium]